MQSDSPQAAPPIMARPLEAGDPAPHVVALDETGERAYSTVERGTAVVWSAALLHEPVTKGVRFVLGVHMYGS